MTTLDTRSTSWAVRARAAAPDLTIALLAVGAIVLAAEIRSPMQLPGHRALIWLSALGATALLTRHRGATTAVGVVAAGTLALTGLGNGGALGALPYVLAALALDAVLLVGAVRRHPILLALLAAPIHLLALIVPLTRSARVGVLPVDALPGMGSVVVLHLVFGLAAGLIGWGVFRLVRRGADER